MTLGTGCNMHGHVGTSSRSRCLRIVMGLNSQHWRIQARSVNNALRFFTCAAHAVIPVAIEHMYITDWRLVWHGWRALMGCHSLCVCAGGVAGAAVAEAALGGPAGPDARKSSFASRLGDR